MRSTWTCFLLSLVSLVAGFTLVLIFTLIYAVPTITARAVGRSRCYVEDLKLLSTHTSQILNVTMVNLSMATLEFGVRTEEADPPGVDIKLIYYNTSKSEMAEGVDERDGLAMLSNQSCLVVTVSYSLPDGRMRKGYLYQHGSSPLLDETLTIKDKCFCRGCNLSLHLSASPHDPMVGRNPHQGNLRQGDTLKCYYRSIMPGQATSTPLTGLLLMNAMFWPTLLFITGFVGVFFTCIFLAKEDWKWRTPPENTKFS